MSLQEPSLPHWANQNEILSDTSRTEITNAIQSQRTFFATGATHEYGFRMQQLQNFEQLLTENISPIISALKQDLQRPAMETLLTEINIVLDDVRLFKKKLRKWMKANAVKIPITLFPARGCTVPQPYGLVLIIGPWNYPFQLVMSPLAGAIAAGNCAIIKPSEIASATGTLVCELIKKYFKSNFVCAIPGSVTTINTLLENKFDYIFYTGGEKAGKKIMHAAAENLTPVTLELGGKSPCIVEPDAELKVTARRIAWGKFLNAGQTCVAPDYLLLHENVQELFLAELRKQIETFFGKDPQASPDFGRIINAHHHRRLACYLSSGTACIGGSSDEKTKYIAPTVLLNVNPNHPIMQDEIFGPILPVIIYREFSEAIKFITSRNKPLAIYLFTKNYKNKKRVVQETQSGCVCINDTVIQAGASSLPFGGAGESGFGTYRGKFSFDTFSRQKAILFRPFWLDIKLRYAPYTATKLRLLKRIIGI